MPSFRSDDTEKTWMERCVPVRMGEGDSSKQAVAACAGMWKQHQKTVEAELKTKEAPPEVPPVIEKSYGMDAEDAWRIPMGATSFKDVAEYVVAEGLNEQMKAVTAIFQELSRNIMYAEAITDKGAALRSLVDELDATLNKALVDSNSAEVVFMAKEKPTIVQRFVEKVKDLAAAAVGNRPSSQPGLFVWKEAGQLRWFAVYSNKYRDQDIPPEILSSKAHSEFVEAVDAGRAPYPELWHYHVPGTRWGVSDWVAYDPATGFSMASGTVDPGHEKEAEAIMALEQPLAVSHSLEVLEFNRQDPTIIESYRTSEISDLPVAAAANKLTGLSFSKGANMIPAEKKAHLLAVGLTAARIGEIEADLVLKAKTAEAAGLQSKEATPDPAPAPVEPEPVPVPVGEVPWAADLQALRVEMAAAIAPIVAGQKSIVDAVTVMAKSDEARIVKAAIDTPAFSIAALVTKNLSAIGTDAARLGIPDMGLAKDRPKEAKDAGRSTGVPWIDDMIGPSQ